MDIICGQEKKADYAHGQDNRRKENLSSQGFCYVQVAKSVKCSRFTKVLKNSLHDFPCECVGYLKNTKYDLIFDYGLL